MESKTLGVLGLGSQSTLFYIKELNRIYNQKYIGFSTCPFKLLNSNFDEINNLLPNSSSKLDLSVKREIDELISLKIDIILVPNITLHETLDRLNISVPIIHPLKTTLTKLKKNNCKNMVLFASMFTMNSTYIKSYFTLHQINVLLPSEEDKQFLDEIRKEIYSGKETKKMRLHYNLLVEKYAKKNAVVIACTELSLGFKNKKELNVYDMSRIQITKAIEMITENN